VRSAKHNSNFTLNFINDRPVTALSVSSEGQLLVGQGSDNHLHVYRANRSHVKSITLPDTDVYDAVWTLRGNIVYCKRFSDKVATMSKSDKVIQETEAKNPIHLSVSTDNVLYLLSDFISVIQSTDDGLKWTLAFEVSDEWTCLQVIKVSTDGDIDVMWTLVESAEARHLQVYKVEKRRVVGGGVTWRNITVPSHVTVSVHSKLVYDGHTSIFVTDIINRAVHVWSVSGQYDRQLVSPQQLLSNPSYLAVDTQRHLMYVGYGNGTVDLFELTYEPV
jgi:WD40 repeat protein